MGISRINLKLNEKAALVIGLGVPSLVLIYYLFKRNPNELDEGIFKLQVKQIINN